MKRINKSPIVESQEIYDQKADRLNVEVINQLEGDLSLGKFQKYQFEVDGAIKSLIWRQSTGMGLWFYATPNHTGKDEIHFQIMSKLHDPDNLQGVGVTGTSTVEYQPPLTLDKYLKIVEKFIERNFK